MSEAGILSRAEEVAGRIPSRRILVIGEILLDEYVFGTAGWISPEVPVPVVEVTGETKVPGGAANVAFNLRGLGAGVEMAGLLGDDAGGRFVARTLKGKRVGIEALIVDPDRITAVKTRVIAHGQLVVRVDREPGTPPSRKASDALLRKALAALAGVDGVVFSGHQKGALTEALVREVTAAANRKGIFVAVDPEWSDFTFYRGCTVFTLNKGEAQAVLGGRELATDLDVWEAGKDLLRAGRSKAVLILRGEEGMTLVERGRGACLHIPAIAPQAFDMTGARDAVIGTLAAFLAAGATMREAAMFANIAASVAAGEGGAAPITAETFLRAAEMRDRSAPPRNGLRAAGVHPQQEKRGARASRRGEGRPCG
jgi:D-beta-D-heptose 7-phosphate kinase/D-beta-D-heptose 1-phosphate adenosyltransferase